IEVTLDDGCGSNTPAAASRIILPQSSGARPTQTAGTVSPLTLATGAPKTSLGLAGLAYAPVAGETALIFTITNIPQAQQGDVHLTDGTAAKIGMVVPLSQLTGATFTPAATPRAASSAFTFTVAGKNPITGAADPNPLTLTIP